MTDTNNSSSGILGNTQAAAAAEATTARQETKVAWQEKTSTHIGVALVLIAVAYLLMVGLEWNFSLKLLTGFAVFWIAGKVISWVGPKLAWHWTGILRTVGAGIITLALAQSGFYALVSSGVNAIEQEAAKAAGVFSPPKPLDAAELAATQERIRQQGVLAGEQAATEAAARAKAAEAERLTTSVSANLPPRVKVPRCSDDKKTWSDIIEIPPQWDIAWGWTGRWVTTQYLRADEEEWRTATTAFIEGDVIAVQFCTTATSRASLKDGMPLTWAPKS